MVTIERRAGVVRTIRPGEVVVRIQQQSACTGCHAKEFCCSTDCADRDITIRTEQTNYQVGEAVVIEGKDSIGRLAVFLTFVVPLILFVSALIVGIKLLLWGEVLALILSCSVLVGYYFLLNILEPKLGRIVQFEIIKAENA